MPAWEGPLVCAAVLLMVAAVPKIRQPEEATRALRSTGLPASDLLVRLLAVVELAVGGYALTVGDRLSAGLVATSYLGFTAFVVLARSRDGVVSSCGCFGEPDTPPTRSHVAVTALLAAGAAGAAVRPVGPVTHLFDDPAQGVALALMAAVCVGFAYLALAVLPTVAAATAPAGTTPRPTLEKP